MPQMANHQWQYILYLSLISIFLLIPMIKMTNPPTPMQLPTTGWEYPKQLKLW